MWPVFEQSLLRYQELEQQLADPLVVADRNRYASAAKEHGALARRIKPYLEYKDITQAEELLAAETDPDMRCYTEEELEQRMSARDQGWKVEDIAFSPGTMGGFKDVIFSITGDGIPVDMHVHRLMQVLGLIEE